MTPMLTSRLWIVLSLLIPLAWLISVASKHQPLSTKPAASAVAATVDGHSIAMHEVELAAAIPLYQLDQQRSQLLHQALQQKIEDLLLNAEASRKGISVSQLLNDAAQSESTARLANLPPPVRRLNSSASRKDLNRESEEDLQTQARIRQALLISLRRKADIHITMTPPKPPILSVSTDDDPTIGPADAPVTIVEFSDFQCSYCRKSVEVLKELRRDYSEKIRLVYRDYPGPNHPYAAQAAQAAQCAGDQGKFWAYHDLLFARQMPGTGWDFSELAKELDMSPDAFAACINTGRYREEVAKDLQDGLTLGITSTPTFFVNGRPLIGARPAADFKALIDAVLAESTQADQ